MRKRVALFLMMAAVVAVSAGDRTLEAGQGKSQAEFRKPLVGSWRLVTMEGGTTEANRGAKPTGLIIYDDKGYMSVQIVPDRPRPKWTGTPTAEQALDAIRGYTAYFGTYTIDEKASTVTHHRQGMLSSGPTDLVRRFEILPGNRVMLTPVDSVGPPLHLTWERVR
jgi:hypothetical protein